MLIEMLLVLITLVLFFIAAVLYIIAKALYSLLTPKNVYERYARKSSSEVVRQIEKAERNVMPFIIKVAMVKIGTVLAIQLIRKKLR